MNAHFVSVGHRHCFAAVAAICLLGIAPIAVTAEEDRPELRGRWEFYAESEGEANLTGVVDYGESRWYLSQELLLLPPPETPSPFTELRPPRRKRPELLDYRRTAVGFSSSHLWFGPLRLQGSLALLEDPLRVGPYSGGWRNRGGTVAATVREPPRRVGVGGDVGPFRMTLFREPAYRRSVALLATPENRDAPPGTLGGELFLSRTVRTGSRAVGEEEPWLLPEPQLMASRGYHFGVAGGLGVRGVEHQFLGVVSTTPRDPPGFALVSAARLAGAPWGLSVATVGGSYRTGELDLAESGVAVTLRRRRPGEAGHTVGGEISASHRRLPAAGAPATRTAAAELRWGWRPGKSRFLEPRGRAAVGWETAVVDGGAPRREASLEATPELRYLRPLRGLSSRLALPAEFTVSGAPGEWNGAVGVEAALFLGAVTVSGRWRLLLSEELQEARLTAEVALGGWLLRLGIESREPRPVATAGAPVHELLRGTVSLRRRF